MFYSLLIYNLRMFIKMDKIGKHVYKLMFRHRISQSIFPFLCLNTRLSLSGKRDTAGDCNVDMHKKIQGTLNEITSVCMYPSISCPCNPHHRFHGKENATQNIYGNFNNLRKVFKRNCYQTERGILQKGRSKLTQFLLGNRKTKGE